jgi:hypothetical protein
MAWKFRNSRSIFKNFANENKRLCKRQKRNYDNRNELEKKEQKSRILLNIFFVQEENDLKPFAI